MSKPLIVELTEKEYYYCAMKAAEREMESRRSNLVDPTKREKKASPFLNLQRSILGNVAEYAVAKHYGGESPLTVNGFKETPDITVHGVSLEVRASSRLDGALIIRKKDLEVKRPYILAVKYNQDTKVQLVGWLYSDEIDDQYYMSPGDRNIYSWFMPQETLRPMSSLESLWA
jgi:hypothetical protein